MENPKAVKEFDEDMETSAFIVEVGNGVVLLPIEKKADEQFMEISGISQINAVAANKDKPKNISIEFVASTVATYPKCANAAEVKGELQEKTTLQVPPRTNGLLLADTLGCSLVFKAPSAAVAPQTLFAPKPAIVSEAAVPVPASPSPSL